MGRGHARATFPLAAAIPERYGGVGNAGGHEVRARDLSAARTEVGDAVRGNGAAVIRRQEDPGEERTNGNDPCRAAGKSERAEAGSVVAGTHHEDHVGMQGQRRVEEVVDAGLPLDLVANPETHVDHERQVAGRREVNGVVERPDHAPGA